MCQLTKTGLNEDCKERQNYHPSICTLIFDNSNRFHSQSQHLRNTKQTEKSDRKMCSIVHCSEQVIGTAQLYSAIDNQVQAVNHDIT